MKPKVCILAAGIGSRLGERTRFFNKSILRVGNKAAISHTIDQFNDDVEFVIALGYQAEIVKQYIEIAHPEKRFTFVVTDKYSGPGAGPGYALLQCRPHLSGPFWFFSCDSIVKLDGLAEETFCGNDWVVCNDIDENEQAKYCTVKVQDRVVSNYYDKSKQGTNTAFAGVAFIKTYEKFWHVLETSKNDNKEIRDTPAIFALKPMVWHQQWFDIGSEEGLLKARNYFKGIQNLDKLDEELYVVDEYVIKYFYNPNMVKDRMLRTEHLNDTIPEIIEHSKNFYKYKFIEGEDLFKFEDYRFMASVLDMAQEKLWSHKKELNDLQAKLFRDNCKKFYYDKTLARIEKLYEKLKIKEEHQTINGCWSNLTKTLNRVDWDYVTDGSPTKFHGDFNLSNIVSVCGKNSYKFLDWRQNFGDSVEYGDLYYDLAKMYHGFLFPHPMVKENKFYVNKIADNEVKTFIEIPCHIEKSKDIFEQWVKDRGYDLFKVKILTGIVLLNMAPLHERPIDEYLYLYAKNYLSEVLDEQ